MRIVPQTRFLLFFVIPMPALSVIGAVALYDLYNAYTQRVSGKRNLIEENYAHTRIIDFRLESWIAQLIWAAWHMELDIGSSV